jgi:hypothetical protein
MVRVMRFHKSRYIILVIVFAVIAGTGIWFFSNKSNREAESSSDINFASHEADSSSDISFSSGVYFNPIWREKEKQVGEVDIVCVPDKETAVQISDIVLKNLQNDGHFKDYVLISVFYDETDEVWIVSYAEDTEQCGNSCSVAISAKTAEILRIWAGE